MSEFEIIHEAFGQKAPNKFSQRIKEIFGINFESKKEKKIGIIYEILKN